MKVLRKVLRVPIMIVDIIYRYIIFVKHYNKLSIIMFFIGFGSWGQ